MKTTTLIFVALCVMISTEIVVCEVPQSPLPLPPGLPSPPPGMPIKLPPLVRQRRQAPQPLPEGIPCPQQRNDENYEDVPRKIRNAPPHPHPPHPPKQLSDSNHNRAALKGLLAQFKGGHFQNPLREAHGLPRRLPMPSPGKIN